MTMPSRELDLLSHSGLTAVDMRNIDRDLVGLPVHDRMGEEIGKVDDLLVDPQLLQVPFLVVGWGGLLGLGHQQRLVPIDALERVEEDVVYLARDKQTVVTGPAFQDRQDPEDAALLYGEVYDLYGVTPYWQREAEPAISDR